MPRLTVRSAANETLTVLDVPSDKPLFFVLSDGGFPVASACGGKAQCWLCRITVLEGWENLSNPVEVEESHLGNLMFIGKLRLSCQTYVKGEATIELPIFESKDDRQRRKANARRMSQERAAARHAEGGRDGRMGPRRR